MRLRLIGWLVVAALIPPGTAAAQTAPGARAFFSGTLDLAYPFGDHGAPAVNRLIRGDSPFDNVRLRLFGDVVINSRWTVFNQILIDPSSREGVQTFLRSYLRLDVFKKEKADLSLQAGVVPPPFGAYSPRAYSNKNPLVSDPLMYHYFTTLRSNQLRKGPELGTGLGLSTVWGLVQSQGGRIQVQSDPGQGTTFTIRMPLARAPSAPAPEPPPETSPALRILVIDDEPATRDVLPQMLAGHTVETAGGGAEGLERFRERPHDVVISDWSMPGLSGLDVAAEVKRRSASTVTVLMTGWEVRGSPAASDPHVDLLLAKPIVMRELDRIVAEAALLLRQRVRA